MAVVSKTPNDRRAGGRLLASVLVYVPLLLFDILFIWLSENPISPNPGLEASARNLSGLLYSNFVYDGITNTDFIVIGSAFLVIVLLYCPRRLRTFVALLLPFVAIAAAGLSEGISILSPFSKPPWCIENCPFYGMSGVASASVGYTFASFFVALVVMFAIKAAKVKSEQETPVELGRFRNQLALSTLFIVYLTLFLLYFLGAFTGQTPAVIIVHYVSFATGLLISPIIWVLVNHHYSLFVFVTRAPTDDSASKMSHQRRFL